MRYNFDIPYRLILVAQKVQELYVFINTLTTVLIFAPNIGWGMRFPFYLSFYIIRWRY